MKRTLLIFSLVATMFAACSSPEAPAVTEDIDSTVTAVDTTSIDTTAASAQVDTVVVDTVAASASVGTAK
jgi:uncharacterized protein YcfL